MQYLKIKVILIFHMSKNEKKQLTALYELINKHLNESVYSGVALVNVEQYRIRLQNLLNLNQLCLPYM